MKYGVYARVKKSFVNFVDEIFSSRFKEPTEEDVFIEEGEGERFVHPNYIIYDMNFLHNYKIVHGKMVETTAADKRKEQGLLPPPEETPEEKIAALTQALEASQKELAAVTDELAHVTERIAAQQELNSMLMSEVYGFTLNPPDGEDGGNGEVVEIPTKEPEINQTQEGDEE